LLLKAGGWTGLIAATCFAVGSTVYSYLFLRARSIPVPLTWLGVLASVLLVVALPLQLAGFLRGPVTWLIWIPMLLFEVPLGLWLLIKGVAAPPPRALLETS
jgi:drug/metabolite transporter (DMT)-like permease